MHLLRALTEPLGYRCPSFPGACPQGVLSLRKLGDLPSPLPGGAPAPRHALEVGSGCDALLSSSGGCRNTSHAIPVASHSPALGESSLNSSELSLDLQVMNYS